jgi:hypothetical protein
MTAANSLPPIVFELISQQLTPEDLPNVRLACRLFAEAAAVTSSIRAIRVEAWPQRHDIRASVRLAKVQHMHVVVSSPGHWSSMQQLAQQLPTLRRLHCSGRRSWYRMASSSTSGSVCASLPAAAAAAAAAAAVPAGTLPCLQTAIFEGTVRGLDDIAALAPNLQELYCSKLMLPRQQQQQQQDLVAEQSLQQLLQLTHFGSESVHVEAEDAADAAAAFAAAFPALQVLFRTPEFGRNLTLSDHIHKTKVGTPILLSALLRQQQQHQQRCMAKHLYVLLSRVLLYYCQAMSNAQLPTAMRWLHMVFSMHETRAHSVISFLHPTLSCNRCRCHYVRCSSGALRCTPCVYLAAPQTCVASSRSS